MKTRALPALLALAAAAFGQSVSFGVKGGLPLTDAFEAGAAAAGGRNYFSDNRRYTLGPTAELRLPFGLGIEFDALYKRLAYGWTAVNSAGDTTANSWEFPLLLKYRSPGILARPFLVAGASFRNLTGLKQTVTSAFNLATGGQPAKSTTDQPDELEQKFTKGVVLGGGVELRAPFVRISPELRYTRWLERNFQDVFKVFGSAQNQAEVLVGITF